MDDLIGSWESETLTNGAVMYVTESERIAAHAKLFRSIDTSNSGAVVFPEFLRWAMDHIALQLSHGDKPCKPGFGLLSMIQHCSPKEPVQFLRAATYSRDTPEYKELYSHLLRCFTDADTSMSGVIDADGFDALINVAAMASHGQVHPSKQPQLPEGKFDLMSDCIPNVAKAITDIMLQDRIGVERDPIVQHYLAQSQSDDDENDDGDDCNLTDSDEQNYSSPDEEELHRWQCEAEAHDYIQ